jgi:glycine/D-amino acid oxidase-like deaminating enzyme
MDFWWAGTFAETKDGLPYVGPFDHKRVLYALGYGGNGITFSAVAANLLRDRILDVRNPDAEIFSFDRVPLSAKSPAAPVPTPLAAAAARPRAAPSPRHRAQ